MNLVQLFDIDVCMHLMYCFMRLTLYQFRWKEKKLVHAMWEIIEQRN